MTRLTRGFALTALVALAVSASAQRPTIKPTPPSPATVAGPWANKLFLPSAEKEPAQASPPVILHDFGTVPHGTLCTQKFDLTNIYDVPIQVIDIRVECGCLKAYPPNKVLQPNERAEFAVTMNAGVFKGPNAKTMYVTFGPNFVSTAVLRFSANSREDVSLTPGEIDFGLLSQGSKGSKTAVLKYNGRQRDWKFSGVASAGPSFEVEVKEASRGALFGVEYWVTVSLKPEAAAGNLNETIAIKTNDPAAPVVNVNVRATVLAPVRATPDRLEFKEVKVGESATYDVLVRTSGSCTLAPLAPDADGISVETAPMAMTVHIVKVKYEPTKAGAFRKELKVQTDLPGNPSVAILVEGTAK